MNSDKYMQSVIMDLDFDEYFESVKDIHNIDPVFEYIESDENNKGYINGTCLYDNTFFKARLILPDELSGDTDYPVQDIAISLTLKLNNQIYKYLEYKKKFSIKILRNLM